MAVASPLVLCDVLCFLHSKQGKLNVKQLKSALMDFYTPEDISVAKVRLLVLLDLSEAFDTVDHQILLSILPERFAVADTALSWFSSYLADRTQQF